VTQETSYPNIKSENENYILAGWIKGDLNSSFIDNETKRQKIISQKRHQMLLLY
jgi:hypothetical protein